jgi:hypothetical protein
VIFAMARAPLFRDAVMLVVAAVLTFACAGNDARTPKAPTVSFRLTGSPSDASVTIDDMLVGRLDVVSAHGVALPIGVHHVSVEAPGYFAWDREIDARSRDTPVKLDATLARIPE